MRVRPRGRELPTVVCRRAAILIGSLVVLLAPRLAQAQGTATATATPAWLAAPASSPRASSPPPSRGITGSAFALRAQGGFASGVPGASGAGLALVGALLMERTRVELSGRYRIPRRARFSSAQAYGATVSLFEIGARGCLSMDFRTFEVPVCAGLAGGRWNATPIAGTPGVPVAKLWVGANVALSILYELDERTALYAGAQGDVSLVRPELPLDPDLSVTPLRPTRFGTVAEIGVEFRFW